MSPKQQRGEATVERALEAALSVYAEEGEQGFTVGAITRAGALSPGSLYHHFGNLDGLVAALVQRWLERLMTPLAGALLEADSAREGISAAVRAYLDFVRDHPDAARLLHSAVADRHGMAHARELRDTQEARLSPLAAWLQHRIATGELAPLSTPLLESLILGPVVATARRHLTLADTDLDEATRELPERIWSAVRG
ncbi:TetR/AcrR family transcriptional regulator [Streptomyces sp. BBFR102]|uniref:TetR/AcrR family transcriptional regulator n=1 Tax=Streptomyces sp. BBFR102 TaxID=3448171 RepID=UPI003F53D520